MASIWLRFELNICCSLAVDIASQFSELVPFENVWKYCHKAAACTSLLVWWPRATEITLTSVPLRERWCGFIRPSLPKIYSHGYWFNYWFNKNHNWKWKKQDDTGGSHTQQMLLRFVCYGMWCECIVFLTVCIVSTKEMSTLWIITHLESMIWTPNGNQIRKKSNGRGSWVLCLCTMQRPGIRNMQSKSQLLR